MPVFNLQANIWYARNFDDAIPGWTLGKPTFPPDDIVEAAIQHQKQASNNFDGDYQLSPYNSPNLYLSTLSVELLVPKRTAWHWPVDVTPAASPFSVNYDIVQCPHDVEHWYYVSLGWDVGRGHANEFRVLQLLPIKEWWPSPVD